MGDKYTIFSKSFMYVETDRGGRAYVPSYVSKAFSRYRYDNEDKVLQKQCSACKKYFNIMKLDNETLRDIHDEDEFHLRKQSGFDTRCVVCNKSLNERKSDVKAKEEKEKNEKYSLFLRPANKKYLDVRAAILGITTADVLNNIIYEEKKRTSLEKLIQSAKKDL